MIKKKIAVIIILLGMCMCCVGYIGESYAQTKPKIVYEQTLRKTFAKKGYASVDRIKCIDKYAKGKWYAYYVYADGDCWVITIKKNKVDVCVQLN